MIWGSFLCISSWEVLSGTEALGRYLEQGRASLPSFPPYDPPALFHELVVGPGGISDQFFGFNRASRMGLLVM